MSVKEMQGRDSFVFYRSFYESIKRLPDDVQIVLFRAVIAYGLDQVEPDFIGVPCQPFVEAIFAGIRPQLDANYKRFLNGCGGGCPPGTKKPSMVGNQNAKKEQNQNETETKPNVNVNDNVNVKVKVKRKSNEPGTNQEDLKIPFTNPEFISTWNELRAQPKWKAKTTRALQMSLDQLSKYNVNFAIDLMKSAIAGNYQGVVFDDTPIKYKRWLSIPMELRYPPSEIITDTKNLYKD